MLLSKGMKGLGQYYRKTSADVDVKYQVKNVTFSGKWGTLKDANVKNQEQMYQLFDVNVFRCTPFPRERHKCT